MFKKALLFGSISALICAVFFLGPWLFLDMETVDFSNSEFIGYFTMVVSMALVALGIYSYRKNEGNGTITFATGLKLGLLITAVSTVLFYIANVLMYEVIAPDFLSDFMEIYPRRLLAENPGDPEVLALTQEYEAMRDVYSNGWIYGLIMAVTTGLMGLVFTLLSSLVFATMDRKKT